MRGIESEYLVGIRLVVIGDEGGKAIGRHFLLIILV